MHISNVSGAELAKTVGEQTIVRIHVDDVAAFVRKHKTRGGASSIRMEARRKAMGVDGVRGDRSRRGLCDVLGVRFRSNLSVLTRIVIHCDGKSAA